ncbi:hypothetical protein EDD21DRAFT_44213 [Dissophora ornata]|nr:hypothetical protein EDD21DRAFT_44213 [Dissophora ornata]
MRDTALARRLSQHIPKSSPSSPLHHIAPSPNSSNSNNAAVAPSPERAFKRTSILHSKKTDLESAENYNVSSPQSGSGSATIVPGGMTAASISASSSPAPLLNNSVSSLSAVPGTTATTTGATHFSTTSVPSHPTINTSSRNSLPASAGAVRTQLGSILASSLGIAGGPGSPNSPTSSSRHFRYPSIPSSNPPPSSPSSSNNNNNNSNNNSASTIDSSRQLPPIHKSSMMSDSGNVGGDKSGSGYSGFRNYTPSVFINIGRTSSSLPQILMPKKRVAQNIASNLSYIAAWYFFSTALSIYNKNLMGKDNFNFNLPLFVSSIHAGLHFVITACLMHFFPDVYDATRSGKGGRITIHSYVTQVVSSYFFSPMSKDTNTWLAGGGVQGWIRLQE